MEVHLVLVKKMAVKSEAPRNTADLLETFDEQMKVFHSIVRGQEDKTVKIDSLCMDTGNNQLSHYIQLICTIQVGG
jgi:predicted nucleotidyltransferase